MDFICGNGIILLCAVLFNLGSLLWNYFAVSSVQDSSWVYEDIAVKVYIEIGTYYILTIKNALLLFI